MKRIKLFIAMTIVSIASVVAQEDGVRLGVQAGTSFDFDQTKFQNLSGGIFLNLPISETIILQPNLFYTRTSSTSTTSESSQRSSGAYTTRTDKKMEIKTSGNSVVLPLFLKYKFHINDNVGIYAGIGPYAEYDFGSHITQTITTFSQTYRDGETYSWTDAIKNGLVSSNTDKDVAEFDSDAKFSFGGMLTVGAQWKMLSLNILYSAYNNETQKDPFKSKEIQLMLGFTF